ncbi:MAG TPA: transketolase [Armatimonadota bacterium]|nr:transketolase [Armatimonadota bacterium]
MGVVDLDRGTETRQDTHELEQSARSMRAAALCAIHAGRSGHPGGSLSIMDICAALYLNVARHCPQKPDWEDRDRIFFSAGHKAPALYSALAHAGYFPVQDIMSFRRYGSMFQGHPHRLKTPGVEVSSGSLGQGLGIAVGAALAARLAGRPSRMYCIMGDGEQQEGSVWEAAMAAGHFGLDNLCAIVDRNGLQIDGRTRDVMSLEPLEDKYRSFGWHVVTCDGHDMGQILAAFDEAAKTKGKPTVIVANTVKGKGVSFMEDQAGWHGVPTKTREQLDQALADVGAEGFTADVVDAFIAASDAFAGRTAAVVDDLVPRFSRDYWWNTGSTMRVDMDPTRMGFGRCLARIGDDPRIVTLHADISNSICITDFEKDHPERLNRVFSVGIAEQNMMQVAAGLALGGYIPITGTYGVFASGRCWDQIRTTICYGRLNVKIAGAHGGISVGPDGATHQSLEEISCMAVLPEMTLVVPCDSVETARASEAAILEVHGPAYIRYAREATPVVTTPDTPFELGKANVIRFRGERDRFVDAFDTMLADSYKGEDESIAIVACGPMVPEAMRAAWILKAEHGIECRVLNVHTIRPLDEAAFVSAAADTGALVTCEEHQAGGLGNIVAGVVSRHPASAGALIDQIGVCGFGESGDPWVLMKAFGLCAEFIAQRCLKVLKEKG